MSTWNFQEKYELCGSDIQTYRFKLCGCAATGQPGETVEKMSSCHFNPFLSQRTVGGNRVQWLAVSLEGQCNS